MCNGDTLTPRERISFPAVTQPVLPHCCVDHSARPRQEQGSQEQGSLCRHGLVSHPKATHSSEEQGGNWLLRPFHAQGPFCPECAVSTRVVTPCCAERSLSPSLQSASLPQSCSALCISWLSTEHLCVQKPCKKPTFCLQIFGGKSPIHA